MKLAKVSFVFIAAALLTFALSGAAFAFHSGGVAQCESCHTMHNSVNGVRTQATNTWNQNILGLQVGMAGPSLVQASDRSSVCLNCHGVADTTANGYHIMSLGQAIPTERTPGGDFAWLSQGGTQGPRKGHSIIAADFGFTTADPTKTLGVSPGGNYPTNQLFCVSCHDPHGTYRKLPGFSGTFARSGAPIATSGSYGADPSATANTAVGAYRLLAGKNWQPSFITNASLAFASDPMNAASPSSYNRSEAASDTLVAYGKGVSEWCANCHQAMLTSTSTVANGHVHPNAQALSSGLVANYNSYVKTGDSTGTQGYTSLVPIQNDNLIVNSQLATALTSTTIQGTAQVMCLTCHRAHAGGFNAMLRWPTAQNMTSLVGGVVVYPTAGLDGISQAAVQAALYDRPATAFAANQRPLCNKCHMKD